MFIFKLAADNYEETMSTLKYASRAKKIENKAKRNEDVSQQVIRKLKEEIEELRRQLAAGASRKGSDTGDDFDLDDGAFTGMFVCGCCMLLLLYSVCLL